MMKMYAPEPSRHYVCKPYVSRPYNTRCRHHSQYIGFCGVSLGLCRNPDGKACVGAVVSRLRLSDRGQELEVAQTLSTSIGVRII